MNSTVTIFGLESSIEEIRGLNNYFSLSQRAEYLKRYGTHSQSFSTLQPDMQYFDMPGIGYIAFMKKWGTAFALSNPVCSPENYRKIITSFVKRYPAFHFVQVTPDVASLLHTEFRLNVTQLGSEIKVPLNTWNTSGKRKQVIRTAINQAKQHGVVIRETLCDDHREEISDAWLKTRKCKSAEIRFLIRPMNMTYRENERRFYAYHDDKPVGFVYFDPIYRNGHIVAYVPNISRANADFKQGLWYPIIAHAMEVFKQEGVEYLDLGLVPLHFEGENKPFELTSIKRILQWVSEKCNFLYNFKGLAFTKSRFNGLVEPTYCCHRSPAPLIETLAIFNATRLI